MTEGDGANGDGTVFRITPSGKLTTLHSFDGKDGAGPPGGADPGHRWELLRDKVHGRGQRLRHGLQNDPRRHADNSLQLLLVEVCPSVETHRNPSATYNVPRTRTVV